MRREEISTMAFTGNRIILSEGRTMHRVQSSGRSHAENCMKGEERDA